MSVSSTSSSSAAATLVVNGLISGISTQQVIQALLEAYQQPVTNLQNEQTTLNNQSGDYKTLNSDMQALLNAAQALNTQNSWNLMTATSSNDSVATATSSPGAQGGTLAFTVNQLAQGNLLLSSGSAPTASATVTSDPAALVTVGAPALGFSALSSSNLSLGSHTIEVTQASQAATTTGASALAASSTIETGTNDTVDLAINGTAYSLTLAPGSGETPSQLAAAFNTAAGNAGAAVSATVNSAGQLQLATTEQGSTASLQVTGGDALGTLGLSPGSATNGADAVVEVDGTETTLNALNPGGTVTLNAPQGTILATLASSPTATGSLLATGTAKAAEVSTGSGSLSDVVNAINLAGVGATASAIQQANGAYRLQVAADSTGLAGAVTLDPSLVSSGSLGTMTTVTAAQDAEVNVGGADGYTLQSSNDTFSSLMPGTTVTVAATGSATVTVSPDASGEASKVSTLVSAANQAVSDLQTLAGYNESTKTGGPLMGSAVLQSIQNQIGAIFASADGTSGLGDAANVGITLNADGSLTFDQSKFESAFSSDPSGVAALFTQDGSFSASSSLPSASATLVYAGDQTAAGSYAVSISHSATQAVDTGATLAGGAVGAAENLTVEMGGAEATYATSAGESLASVAAGLNGAFSSGGLDLVASVVNSGTQLEIASTGYGSATTFQVTSSSNASGTTGLGGATAGTPASFAGTDVAGSINGVAATGTGQLLVAPSADSTLNGLSIEVPVSGITSPTPIGTFTYSPGLAQQLVTLANNASNAETGSLTTTAKGLSNEATGLNSQISMYESFESTQQQALEGEFQKMEDALGNLKNEGSELSSQLANL